MTAAGHPVTASGIKQRRQRYQRDGLVGLADGRSAKQMPPFGMVDAVVVEAMRRAIGETADDSPKTISFIVWQAKEILPARRRPPMSRFLPKQPSPSSTASWRRARPARTDRSTPGRPAAALAMVFKLVESAQARRRVVTDAHLVALVRAGATFENGIHVEREQATAA
ncbi:hypothetical protein [Streptomyces sp. NPDC058202]|uniref:hypothetical protein n=1 Tax=Streptomyces sp. NPDC058202 TaxID=3346380 RepID=UPI0036E69F16